MENSPKHRWDNKGSVGGSIRERFGISRSNVEFNQIYIEKEHQHPVIRIKTLNLEQIVPDVPGGGTKDSVDPGGGWKYWGVRGRTLCSI